MSLKLIYTLLKCSKLLRTRNIQYLRRFASHYETLKVKKDSTQKEIRESFIKLSKQHHPDVDKSKEAHERFLKINEAYKVLSKPNTRQLYDLGYSQNVYVEVKSRPGTKGPAKVFTQEDPWDDPSFYNNRDKSQDKYYEKDPYYGIKGVQKMSNTTIALLCMIFATFGVILQAIFIRQMFNFNTERMNTRSREAFENYSRTRELALTNGTETQIEIFKKRMEEMNKTT